MATSQSNVNDPKAMNKHPTVRFFHLIFKSAAILYFIFCKWIFTEDFVINFIVILVLMSCDFWVVKNITGRLLVGLRWWNDVSDDDDDGDGWRFESLEEGQREIGKGDKYTFWLGMITSLVLWILALVVCILTFSIGYVMLSIIAIVLTCANLWGYFKCSREAKKALKEYASQAIASGAKSAANTLTAAMNRV